MSNPECVCAVVVTYNRKALLVECLGTLLAQTHLVTRILLLDNASTDGTPDLLRASGFLPHPRITYVPLPANVGGAGGFHEGVKRAAADGNADWLWLLDDDTIVRPDALAELLAARRRFPEAQRPDLLASRVLWTDGTMHPTNVPWIKRNDLLESVCLAAEHGTVSLRSTSFVSVLLHRRFVERYGLPVADYFLGVDDVEYTGRILRENLGVLAPRSVVVHKTTAKHADPGPRFYHGLRNSLWMIRLSPGWSREEKLKRLAATAKETMDFVRLKPSWARMHTVARGLLHGLVRTPRR